MTLPDATAKPADATAKPADPPPPPQPQPTWMKRVPLITGGLAALAGYLTVRGADLSNNAIYQSNQAVLMQARSSDLYAEYEADSVKKRLVDVTLLTLPPTAPAAVRGQLTADSLDLNTRQPPLKARAEDLAHQRDQLLSLGAARLAEKAWADYAGVAAQLGIALASVAALTRRPAAFTAAVLVGLGAAGLTVYALLAHLLHH